MVCGETHCDAAQPRPRLCGVGTKTTFPMCDEEDLLHQVGYVGLPDTEAMEKVGDESGVLTIEVRC